MRTRHKGAWEIACSSPIDKVEFYKWRGWNPFLLQFLSNRSESLLMCVLGTSCVHQHQSLILLWVWHPRLLFGIWCWEKERRQKTWEAVTCSAPASVSCIPPTSKVSHVEVIIVMVATWLPKAVLIWTYWLKPNQAAMVLYAEAIAEQNRQICLPSWGWHCTEQDN